MQKQKNTVLFISLIVVIIACVGIAIGLFEKRPTFIDTDIFKVENLNTVDRIELTSKSDTVILHFNGRQWMVNNMHNSDPNMIDVLFATLLQAVPKHAVPIGSLDSISAFLKTNGVHIQIFENDIIKQDFITGGNIEKTESYFMNSAGEVYITHIPGYRVYVSGIFELPESEWRDKYVFNFNWTNFQGLKVHFFENLKSNFTVSNQKGFFAIDQLPTDTTKLNDFLDAISLLTVDEYIEPDRTNEYTEFMKLTVTDIANREYTLVVYKPLTEKILCLIHSTQWAWIDLKKLTMLMNPIDFYSSQTKKWEQGDEISEKGKERGSKIF